MKILNIYIVESQEIFTNIYRSVYTPDNGFDLLGIDQDMTYNTLKDKISDLRLDVLLIGSIALTVPIINTVQQLRIDFPNIGSILLFETYHSKEIKLLCKLTRSNQAGIAVFLKSSLERTEQLLRITVSVRDRHFIVDPSLTSLLFNEKDVHVILKELTTRELEILRLISEGHTNQSIARTLYIDVKTVRHHINSIYNKLKSENGFNQKHPRVSVTRLYLETTGDLLKRSLTV